MEKVLDASEYFECKFCGELFPQLARLYAHMKEELAEAAVRIRNRRPALQHDPRKETGMYAECEQLRKPIHSPLHHASFNAQLSRSHGSSRRLGTHSGEAELCEEAVAGGSGSRSSSGYKAAESNRKAEEEVTERRLKPFAGPSAPPPHPSSTKPNTWPECTEWERKRDAADNPDVQVAPTRQSALWKA